MTFAPKTAAILALVLGSTLALAACGGEAEVSDEPAVTTTAPAPVAAPLTDEAAAPDAAATPAADGEPGEPDAEASPAPAATPTAVPTPAAAASAAPAATQVAARPPDYAVCAACHSTEPGRNGIGPTLAGVYGARAGHIEEFDYSAAMEESGLVWDETNLDRYLADPRGVVPGTKMAYPGLKDAAKRKAMVEYLKTL